MRLYNYASNMIFKNKPVTIICMNKNEFKIFKKKYGFNDLEIYEKISRYHIEFNEEQIKKIMEEQARLINTHIEKNNIIFKTNN